MSTATGDYVKEIKFVAETIKNSYSACRDDLITFCDMCSKLMDNAGWTYNDFEEYTLHNRNTYYAIKNNNLKPEIETIVAICIGLGLDIHTSEELLSRRGLGFDTSSKHYTYRILITLYSHNGIDYCNDLLEEMAMPLLGSKER
jgi:hypothetical protein